jgi:hypothetical protein
MATRVLIPSGALGLGFDSAALARGVAQKPDIICIDGGSTDSGPFYLGTGTSKYSRAATKSEWRELMLARATANVPLMIGTAGTCGTDATVDWMYDITRELAEELGQTVRIVRLYCSQDIDDTTAALARGEINPLSPKRALEAETVQQCSNIVALAGAEQIQRCLAEGADIVIAGRTTDTATIAALPLANGDLAGGAWHGAKIGECGAYCSSNPTSGVILVEFDETGFTVEPLAGDAICTPQSVSAHMLYENADPFILHEPGGHLDVSNAKYSQLDQRRVRVTGSDWVTSPDYTVKLEGSQITGYQSIVLATIREPRYVIGIDSTLGDLETGTNIPNEVGALGIATAKTAELADEMVKLANPFFLHYPLSPEEPQVTFAFPFSPANMSRGALYEFCLNHVRVLTDPMASFRLRIDEVNHGQT